MGNEQIFVGTRWAGRAGSRLHDSIVMCLIAPEMVELFKKSECWHWAPIFDIWVLRCILGFSLPFLISPASWLILRGVMTSRCQAVIILLRIVSLCDRWL